MSLHPFYKTVSTERFGDVLALKYIANSGPQLQFHFDPGVEGIDICQINIGFPDTDEGRDQLDRAFEIVQPDGVEKTIAGSMDQLAGES